MIAGRKVVMEPVPGIMLLNGGSGGTRPFDTFPLVPLPLKEEKKTFQSVKRGKKK